jgi:uncharacterized RDD family membrane protein YckC
LAFVIDTVFVWVLGMLLGTAVGIAGLLLTMYTKDGPPPLNGLIIGTGLIFSLAYFIVAWSRSGQTIGKMAVGIKVVGADGQPPSGGRAVLRYIGYIISGLVLALGYFWVIYDQKRQGWHDKIAGTYVVYSDSEFSDINGVQLEPAEGQPSLVWIVLWVVLAIAVPSVLTASVFVTGPYVSERLISVFANGG